MIRYLRFFIITVAVFLLLMGSLTFFINPYSVFWPSPLAGFFERKTAAADKGRNIKSYMLLQRRPEVLLIGNSRVEIGLPSKHKFYKGEVFNLGLPGAGVLMQYDYGWHAILSTGSVKQIVIAIDFVDFLTQGSTQNVSMVGSWQQRLNFTLDQDVQPVTKKWFQLKEYLSFLVSQSALFDSVLTLAQQKSDVNALSSDGFNDGRLYHKLVRQEGFEALYEQKQRELQQRLKNPALKLVPTGKNFKALSLFLTLLHKQKIDVTLLINPYHYPYLDTIEQSGLQDEFLQWKQLIKELASQHQLPLYDFSIRSEIVMQPLIDKSYDINENAYFWEPAHYRHALGSLILDVLASHNCEVILRGQRTVICHQLSAGYLH
jgi:hypothetical protein